MRWYGSEWVGQSESKICQNNKEKPLFIFSIKKIAYTAHLRCMLLYITMMKMCGWVKWGHTTNMIFAQ